jgi:hypothetical protein
LRRVHREIKPIGTQSEGLSGNPAYQDFGISLEFLSGFCGSVEPNRAIGKWDLSGNGAYTLRGDSCGFVVIWALGLDFGPWTHAKLSSGPGSGPWGEGAGVGG